MRLGDIKIEGNSVCQMHKDSVCFSESLNGKSSIYLFYGSSSHRPLLAGLLCAFLTISTALFILLGYHNNPNTFADSAQTILMFSGPGNNSRLAGPIYCIYFSPVLTGPFAFLLYNDLRTKSWCLFIDSMRSSNKFVFGAHVSQSECRQFLSRQLQAVNVIEIEKKASAKTRIHE